MRVFFFSQKSHRCPSEGQICMWEGRWLVALRTPQRRCLRQIDQYEVISVQYYTITVWEQLVELWPHLAVSPWWADHAAVRTVVEKGVHCHCTTTNHCTSHTLLHPPCSLSHSGDCPPWSSPSQHDSWSLQTRTHSQMHSHHPLQRNEWQPLNTHSYNASNCGRLTFITGFIWQG